MHLNPIIAAGGHDLWPFIIGGVFLLIKWLTSKSEESDSDSAPRTTRPVNRPAQTEEERTRRFLEALGLPAQNPPPAKPLAPPPPPREFTSLRDTAPPPPPRQRTSLPAPPPIPSVRKEPRHKKKSSAPKPAVPAESVESPRAFSTEVEKTHLPELDVPAYHEFRTTSSEVQAIPFEGRKTEPALALAPRKNFSAAELRDALRSRTNLRAAVVLREILGPPPGLQSSRSHPSFPSP